MADDNLLRKLLQNLGLGRDLFDSDLLDFVMGGGSRSETTDRGDEKSEEDLRTSALIKILNHRGDRECSFLSGEVSGHADEVVRLNSEDLYRAHAHAAVYVGNLEAAVASFSKVKPTDRELAVMGLIAYDAGDYIKAERDLEQVTRKIAQVRMAISSIKLSRGEIEIRDHVHLLSPVGSSTSGRVYLHTLLGINTFNHGDYGSAEHHFQFVLDTDDTPEAQLNVMRAKFKQGKNTEVWSMAVKYMYDAHLNDAKKLTEQLGVDQIEFPRYVVNRKTLYNILVA